MRGARRGISGHQRQWNRLRPATIDPLEEYGLPSKGDSRLLDARAQEQYYNDILDRCLGLRQGNSVDNVLNKQFKALNLDLNEPERNPRTDNLSLTESKRQDAAVECVREASAAGSKNLDIIVQAMRKLREAILASARFDSFARDVYVLIVRATISSRHMESYHPSLLHLIHRIHPLMPLSKDVLHEMLGYHILDAACRQADLKMAYELRLYNNFHDPNINLLLSALASGRWTKFWLVKTMLDPNQQVLADFASERMCLHALESLGRSYLNFELSYLEQAVQKSWGSLTKVYDIKWTLDGNKVTVKSAKRK